MTASTASNVPAATPQAKIKAWSDALGMASLIIGISFIL
jgi:hypothetical protein